MANYTLTRHAEQRAKQRGIQQATIALVLSKADRSTRAPGGVHKIWVTNDRRKELVRHGTSAAEVDRCRDVALIIDRRTRSILTAHHGPGRRRTGGY